MAVCITPGRQPHPCGVILAASPLAPLRCLSIDRIGRQPREFACEFVRWWRMRKQCTPEWTRAFRDFGDARRTRRFQRMIATASATPGRTIASTFSRAAERQAAYDYVEHAAISADQVVAAVANATARSAAAREEVLLILDGSSLSLVDEARVKGFGSVGTKVAGARGIKVLTSLVCGMDGVPIGAGRFVYWCRGDERVDKKRYRPLRHRESFHWHEAVDGAVAAFAAHASDTKLHVVADREADASAFLKKLIDDGHEFTIRSGQADRVLYEDGRKLNLRRRVRKAVPMATYELVVPATSKRPHRRATLEVRTAEVDLHLRDHHVRTTTARKITVVWAREVGYTGPDRLDWVLYTSKRVLSAADVAAVIGIYRCRWGIEDFHRAWKRGGANVEKNQLRSASAVIKWATVTAVAAVRAEHLKRRSRAEPDAPAASEFTADELEALRVAKNSQKSRVEKLVEGDLSLAIAVRWVADIGGYVGNRSSGPPGATVIGRGLEHLAIYTQALLDFRESQKR